MLAFENGMPASFGNLRYRRTQVIVRSIPCRRRCQVYFAQLGWGPVRMGSLFYYFDERGVRLGPQEGLNKVLWDG